MKLYYMKGACSLSPHIALREAGADFELVAVGRDKQTADGKDFRTINPYGYVPALVLDDGEVFLEGPAIVQYIADRYPTAGLAPENGSRERVHLQSALGLVNSEIHKTISGLFNPSITDDAKAATIEKIGLRLDQVSARMGGSQWLANDSFSVADIYLYVVLRWLPGLGIELSRWPTLAAHSERVAARPATQAALQAERLV